MWGQGQDSYLTMNEKEALWGPRCLYSKEDIPHQSWIWKHFTSLLTTRGILKPHFEGKAQQNPEVQKSNSM